MKIDVEGKEVVDATTKTTDDYFSLYYRKIDNEDFFNSLETSEIKMRNLTNYIPIYESYFNMNETNYNSFNLNQRYYVSCLSGVTDRNNIEAAVVDTFKSKEPENSITTEHKPVYIKFSPLLDPLKYLSGKYATTNIDAGQKDEILSVPKLSKIIPLSGMPKVNDKNNSSYVDSFFSYLSSQILNHHNFIHGLDFYGSFNGIKSNFYYNVIDDIDYLDKNTFFSKNKNILFSIEDEIYNYGENAGYDDIDDDHISLDSMGKVKPRNNTRNRRAKIKIIDYNSCETRGGNNSGDISDTQYIIHDDFNNISNELNAVFSSNVNDREVKHTSEVTSLTDVNLESLMMVDDDSILSSSIHLKGYHSDSDSHSNDDTNNDDTNNGNENENHNDCEYSKHKRNQCVNDSNSMNDDSENDSGNDDSSCSSRSSYTSCSESDGGDSSDGKGIRENGGDSHRIEKGEKGEKGEKNDKMGSNKNNQTFHEEDSKMLKGQKRKTKFHTLNPAKIDTEMGIEARSFDTTIENMNRIQTAIIWGEE